MDFVFKCPHCSQELEVDSSGAGTEIQCPSCEQNLIIPDPSELVEEPVNPIKTSAEAHVIRHFSVPQHEKPAAQLIEKPLRPLEAVAKGTGALHVKTFKRSDCVEVGKDNFDKVVSHFLGELSLDNIISIHPIQYSHQDLATRDWIADYGVIIVYKD